MILLSMRMHRIKKKKTSTAGKAKGYASNAANFEDTAKVVEEIHKDFGRIDILVTMR